MKRECDECADCQVYTLLEDRLACAACRDLFEAVTEAKSEFGIDVDDVLKRTIEILDALLRNDWVRSAGGEPTIEDVAAAA